MQKVRFGAQAEGGQRGEVCVNKVTLYALFRHEVTGAVLPASSIQATAFWIASATQDIPQEQSLHLRPPS
jgi:hypothetical protein